MEKEFRPSKGFAVLLIAIAAAAAGIFAVYRGPLWVEWFFAGFSIFAVIAAIGSLRTRITFHADRIEVVDDFKRQTLPKDAIESAHWARGCPASVTMKDGRVIKLPSAAASPQKICSAITSWKKS